MKKGKAYEYNMPFNPDNFKKAQEVIFSREAV